MLSHRHRVLASVCLVAAAGVLFMLAANRFGAGITPDSVVYLDAARNLANGQGLVAWSGAGTEPVPLTHYPPLYPGALALAGSVSRSLPAAARWLNALLFGANIFLVGLAIGAYASDSLWLPVLGAFLTLAAPDIAKAHSFALSEPLFVFFTIAGLLCLGIYFRESRATFLLLSATSLALAFATRYVGIVAIATGVLMLLVFHRGTLLKRLLPAAGFGALACAPMALWSLRNYVSTSAVSDRQFAFHPGTAQHYMAGLSNLAAWFLVGRFRRDLLAFLIELIVVACLVLYLTRSRKPPRTTQHASASRLPHLLAAFIIFYVAFLLFTLIFVEADTVFDDRLLMPAHVAAIILLPCLAWSAYLRTTQSRAVRLTCAALALILAGSSAVRGLLWFARIRGDGQIYAATAWQQSPTINRVRSLPDVPIYSNGAEAIYYLTGRPALFVPQKILRGTARPNTNGDQETAKMYSVLRERGGVLVYFNALSGRTFFSEQELLRQMSLRLIAADPDGSLYTAPP